jgi:hypothetical protein
MENSGKQNPKKGFKSPPSRGERSSCNSLQVVFWRGPPARRIRSDEIEDFLESRNSGARRRNNLRSEIITLFRYSQARFRALPRERKTEPELVIRNETKRTSVATFSPEEFEAFLGAVRLEWRPFDGADVFQYR